MPTPITPVATWDDPITVAGVDTPSAAGMLEVLQTHANRAEFLRELCDALAASRINGALGGEYNPASSPISIGGFGLELTGANHYLDGTLTVADGGFITIGTGGTFQTANGRITIDDLGRLFVRGAGAVEVVDDDGQIQVRDGGFCKILDEGTFEIGLGGWANFLAGSVVNADGTITVGDEATLEGRRDRSIEILNAGGRDPDQALTFNTTIEYVYIEGAVTASRSYTLGANGGRPPRLGDQMTFALGGTGGSTTHSIGFTVFGGSTLDILDAPMTTGKYAYLRRADGYANAVTFTCVSASPAKWHAQWQWF